MMQNLVLVPDQTEDLPKLIVQPAANTAINNVQQHMLDILQVMRAAHIAKNQRGRQ